MPHAELKYSSDLNIDTHAILKIIEATIQSHDTAGACKGRAYPTDQFNHTHFLVDISMLTKAHRDKAFTDALIADLEPAIKAQIHQPCAFSLKIDYTGDTYINNMHSG
jgi:hypothetical protein